jgi:hypothetical protein
MSPSPYCDLMTIRSRIWATGAALLVLAAVLYPAQVTVVPQYAVRVLDADGQPFRSIRVNQDWQEYSVQAHGLRDTLTTDNEGYAHFPAKTVRASIGERIAGCTHQFTQYGAHASCGSHYDITAGDGSSVELRRVDVRHGAFGGSTLTLTMKRCPAGQYWPC